MNNVVRRTVAIAHKEMLHMVRDVRVLYLALGLPVVMLLLFGYGVSTDVDHVKIAIVDQDHTRASRRLPDALAAGGQFVVAAELDDPDQVEPLFRRGRVSAALVVPRDYGRRLLRGDPADVQILVDGADSSTATITLGNAIGILQPLTTPNAQPTAPPPVLMRFNPAMRSAYGIVPGVIALILSMVSALLAALTIAREWERGSMEQLFATPVRRSEIIIGKLLPYAVLGMVQTLMVVTLGSWMFDVPIRGSLGLLFLCSLLFQLAMLGIGLLVSVATKSQLLSSQFSIMISMLPTMLLGGFLFPIANMPWPLRAISAVVPGRYYIVVLRGVFLKGNGIAMLAPQVLALVAFAIVVLVLAVWRFHRRLE
jgi:ABC-2 type transport system permease protein